MSTCIQRMSPMRSSTTRTRSMSPIDTPPLDRTASQVATPRSMVARMASSSSRTCPRSTGVNPASATRASSVGRLLSRIWPGCSGAGPTTSSSPVDSTPTRGRRERRHRGDAERRQHADPGGRDLVARRQHLLAGLQVLAHGPQVGAGVDRHLDADGAAAVEPLGPLDHDDGVGAVGDGGAGEDPHRLPGPEQPVGRVPGRHLRHHGQGDGRAGDVGGPHRVAVHGGVGERRDGLGRHHVVRQHETRRLGERARSPGRAARSVRARGRGRRRG